MVNGGTILTYAQRVGAVLIAAIVRTASGLTRRAAMTKKTNASKNDQGDL